jgi:hypothetical protein
VSRKLVTLLFILYFLAAMAAAFLSFGAPYAINPETIGETIGTGFSIYIFAGMLPFAFWGARGFRAASAASNLFIPWAVFAALAVFLLEYGS